MNMYLTLEEQRNLTEKKIPNNRTFPTCPQGHELAILCFRMRIRPSTVKRIKSMFYCPQCDKIFKPSMVEVKI